MPGSRLNVHLFRDSFNTPWGFRLQGGKDLNQPLTVQRVFSNSPAEGELQRGDVILSINNRDSAQLTHKQAQDLIKHGGGQVELVVNRPPPGAQIGPLSPPIVTQKPRAPSLQIPKCKDSTVRYLTIHKVDTNSTTQYDGYYQKPPLTPSSLSPQFKTTQEPQTQHTFERQRSWHSQSPSTPQTPTQLPPWAAQQLASKKKAQLSKLGGGGHNFGTTYATLPRGSSANNNVRRPHTLNQPILHEADEDHQDRLATGPIPKVCRLRNLGGGDFSFGAPYGSATLPRSNVGRRLSQPVGSSNTASYGFQPTKVTVNKYGGSGPEFGSDFSAKGYGQTAAQRYEPRHDKSAMLNRVQSSLDNLTLSPRSPEVHASSPFYQPYEPPYHSPQQVYTPTGLLLEQQRLQEAQHEGEVIAPVWERRRQFQQAPVQSPAVRSPSNRPPPKISKPRPGTSGFGDLGTDYSHSSGKQPQTGWRPAPHFNPTQAHYTQKPAPPPTAPKYSQPSPTQAPVHSTPAARQRHEEPDTGTPAWRSSLKATGVKPWEMDESFDNDQQQVRSVPYHPTPAKSPISPGPFSPTGAPQISDSQNGPKVMHLQYNSPMHLYSNQNVAETLKGQTQAMSGQNRPPPPATNESGERDWSQSAVLRFITQEDSKKDKLPPPSVAPKPLYSPVQAPRSPQPFYQDSGASEF